MNEINEIVHRVFISSIHEAQNKDLLTANKITHVINISSHTIVYPTPVKILRIKIGDSEDAPIHNYFTKACTFIVGALRDGGNVLVHCNAGISRSSTIVIAFLMKKRHLSFSNAYELVKAKRPMIRPNEGFTSRLRQIES